MKSSLWPELTPEYIRFSDDFIVLSDMSVELASRVRFLKDMSRSKGRGQGPWQESLWHTHDVLKRLGYPVLNYETHTPAYFRKEWAVHAFRDLRDYVSEDRWFGLTGATGNNGATGDTGLDWKTANSSAVHAPATPRRTRCLSAGIRLSRCAPRDASRRF